MKRTSFCMGVALALGMSSGAQARTPAPAKQQLGVVTAAVETIVRQNPDGSVVTTVRPVKDLAAFFADMGVSVPIAPADSICLPPVTVIGDPGGDGGGGVGNPPVGGNGGGNTGGGGGGSNGNGPAPPPTSDVATAQGTNPPTTVTTDQHVTGYSETLWFSDGWSVDITWARTPNTNSWTQVNLNWHKPNSGSGAGNSTQGDCDENPE